MKQYIDNERGNGVILTIFSFAIVGIMLILVLNIAMVFTTKEQTAIAAEHASIAATSVVFEKVEPIIQSHVKEVIIGVDENGVDIIKYEPLIDKVIDRENAIKASKPWLSNNEVHIQAVNQVLSSEIPDDDKLKPKISNAINSAKYSIPSVINSIVDKNIGDDINFKVEWKLDGDNRIEVIAKTEYEPVKYEGLNFGGKNEIPQKGKGPKISFLEEAGW